MSTSTLPAVDQVAVDVAHRPIARRRRLRPLLVAALAVALVELATRLAPLPAPLEWSMDEAQVKADELADLGTAAGVDTVFVGSSVVDVAVRPDRFAARAGLDGPAYNAALLGVDLRSIRVWVEEYVVPTVAPDRVVLGLSCRELNGAEPAQDAIHREFVAAPAVAQRLGTETTADRIERRAGDWSAIVRYRSVLRIPRSLLGRDRRVGINLDVVDGGFNQAYADRTYPAAPRELMPPAELSQFRVGRRYVEALDATLASLRAAGIEAVVVHMPATEDFVSYVPGPRGTAVCADVLAERARAGGATFLDGGVLDRSLFADPMHVNGAGADVVTDLLADALGPTREG